MTTPQRLILDRPLAVFDIESTGTSPRADRIIEIAVVKLLPGNKRITKVWRLNPQMPIPPESTQIHGITDADVADCPVFTEVATDIHAFLENCDLCGYNAIRFDIPMLIEEFIRADIVFNTDELRLIDAQRIFHRREPRDLTAALAYYCGEMHFDAHGAEADAEATLRVLEAQLQKYSDLPSDLNELHEYCNPKDPNWVDKTGKLKWTNGHVVINFGKRKGELIEDLIKTDPSFIKWILNSDFPADTREIIKNSMNNIWPQKPQAKS